MRPIVLERADKHLMGLDLASKLMQDRIIMLDEEITEEFASQVITQLLYLKNTAAVKNPEAINKTAPETINRICVNHIGVIFGLISNNPLANNPDTPHITAAIAARNVHNLRVFAGTI